MSEKHITAGFVEQAFAAGDPSFAEIFSRSSGMGPSSALRDLAAYQLSVVKRTRRDLDWYSRSQFIVGALGQLLAIGANPRHKEATDTQESPIFYAVHCSSPDVVSVLLNAGASAELSDSYGTTLFDWAMTAPWSKPIQDSEWQSEIAMLLLQHGAIPMSHDRGGPSLLLAANNGLSNVVSHLLDQGADANWMDDRGSTPLMVATSNAQVQVVKLLLAAGADPLLVKREKNLPFHFRHPPVEIAELNVRLQSFPHRQAAIEIVRLLKQHAHLDEQF